MLEIIKSPQIIVAIIGALSGAFLVWLKYYLDSKKAEKDSKLNAKKDPDKVVAAIEFNEQIQSKIEDLRESLNADRISIYRFHNGGHYYPKTDMQKFSMVYERVSSGIATTIHTHQNFLVSAFHWYLNKVIKQNSFKYSKISTIEDYTLRDFMVEMGLKSVYVFPLFSLNGHALGLLSIHFIKNEKELSEDLLEIIQSEINIFSGYLDH